ncbi:MAG TPA: TPM domain-containing protein [Thermoanaerobaculia bacterium]|nr:TPM domain-containing protein [Thermoanaerobaculia bacterium]
MRTTLSRFTLALLTTAATLSVASCGQVPAKGAAGARGRPPQSREAIHVPAAPTRWVTDGVGLLSEAARRELDVSLERYEKETGHQVIVWIGDSTHGQRLEDFATRSFNAWGIGRKGANDGVAFFVFSDDSKIRLEVGDGLVGVLPDSTAAAIINEVVMPRLASGEKDQALVKGVAVTLRVLNGEQWKSLEGAFRAPSSAAALAEGGR